MPLDQRLRDELHRAAASIEPDVAIGLERVRRRAESRSTMTAGMMVTAAIVIAILFVVVILPGRRQDGPGGAGPSDSPAASATRVTGVVGSWRVVLTASDAGVSDLGMAGVWDMTLGADFTIDLRPPSTFTAPSGADTAGYIHTTSGDSFLTNLFARDFAASCTGPGRYDWSVSGDRLTFVNVDDTCDARRTLLTPRPWSALPTAGPG